MDNLCAGQSWRHRPRPLNRRRAIVCVGPLKILDRYLIREIAAAVPPRARALHVSVLAIKPMLDQAPSSSWPRASTSPTVGLLLTLLLPQALGITIPMAFLAGLLMALGRLSGDRGGRGAAGLRRQPAAPPPARPRSWPSSSRGRRHVRADPASSRTRTRRSARRPFQLLVPAERGGHQARACSTRASRARSSSSRARRPDGGWAERDAGRHAASPAGRSSPWPGRATSSSTNASGRSPSCCPDESVRYAPGDEPGVYDIRPGRPIVRGVGSGRIGLRRRRHST